MNAIAMTHQDLPDRARTIDEIEDEISVLSATIQAATHRLLVLIEEMDRREGWADPLGSSYRSMAHWLSHRVGLDLGAARQYVRVARALPGLPRISEAFSRGELSYSKVRALTRIADAMNEETLVGWARAGTASHIETLVRKYRRGNRMLENEQAEAREAARGLRTWFDSDGMLVVEGRLTPEQGALLVKALDRARDELYARPDVSAEPPGDKEKEETDHAMRQADALGVVAERALLAEAGMAGDGDRFQVVVHMDREVLSDPEADGRCELEEGPALAADTARRLACNGSISVMEHGEQGDILPGRKTRVISAPLRRALHSRDGTRCVFPGCPCRGRDAHHVQHWADGGPTVLGNLASLCRFHHTLVHEGRYRMVALGEGGFRFLDPSGRVLADAPEAPQVTGDPVSVLADRWMPADVEIGPQAGRPTWEGEAFDYEWAIEDLQARAGLGRDEGTSALAPWHGNGGSG